MLALFLFGFLALNPPLLSVFDSDGFIMGLPLLYFYLFASWVALIVLMALGMESRETPPTGGDPDTDRSEDSS